MPVNIEEVIAEVPSAPLQAPTQPTPPQADAAQSAEALRAEREREHWRQARLSAD